MAVPPWDPLVWGAMFPVRLTIFAPLLSIQALISDSNATSSLSILLKSLTFCITDLICRCLAFIVVMRHPMSNRAGSARATPLRGEPLMQPGRRARCRMRLPLGGLLAGCSNDPGQTQKWAETSLAMAVIMSETLGAGNRLRCSERPPRWHYLG